MDNPIELQQHGGKPPARRGAGGLGFVPIVFWEGSMSRIEGVSIVDHFEGLEDPRIKRFFGNITLSSAA
jgi:hypothetical protein